MSTSMCAVTIVTATYNVVKAGRSELLRRCIRSVAALKVAHEHLIVDGASDDGTTELLRDFGKEPSSSVRVVSEKDKGIYDAYNKGAQLAKGEWVYYLGCDDYIVYPEVMAEALARAESKRTDFVVSPVQLGNARVEGVRLHTRLLGMGYSHQGVIMRRSAILEFGGFDLQYKISGDVDLTFRMHLAGRPFCVYDKIYAYFDDGGLSTVQLTKTREESTRSVATHLALTDRQLAVLRKKRILPFWKSCALLFHRDRAIRQSAMRMVLCNCLNAVGLIGDGGRLRWQK